MYKNLKRFSILFFFSILSISVWAQYGPQFDNRGFEQWTTRASEPSHWHSGGTADGTYSGYLPDDLIVSSTHTRPGSTGTKSVRLVPKEVGFLWWTYVANGCLTNGRMHAGDTDPDGSGNYNYTQRSTNGFNTSINQLPDSLSIWVCFRCTTTTDKAQVKAVVHGNADYQIIANGTEAPANMHVATAVQSFSRTSTANGAYTWRRLSIPFNNNGPCTDVRYILFTATTNETPASGSTSDDLFIDDVLLIYNPTLSMGQLSTTSFAPGDAVTIPFTLTGTMSPDNLNASANQVIAQLSDTNGSFNNPTELGRVTTNTSGSISAQIPNVANGQYTIRVISTNYPMIGQNPHQVTIANPSFTISVSANPSEGGTVTGGGEYTSGQSCTVTATANANYTFTNWTEGGNVVSTNASYTFSVTGNRTLVANFTYVPPTYTITVSANPSEGGNVTGGGTYTEGQSCTVNATANANYTFTNWTESGNVVSTNASYTFTVNGNRTLVANFTYVPPTYTITVSANPSEGGTVTGGGTYSYGQSCSVHATAATGYTFINWTENGAQVSSQADYTFTVTSDRNLVANFSSQSYIITATADPREGGVVTGSGGYNYGDACTLTATANQGYTFVNWTKDGMQVSTNATYSFTVTESASYVAHFSINSYTVSATADPSEGGTVSGAGDYQHGTSCTLSATANENYEFINWTKDGNEVSTNANYTFTVTESGAYVAHFRFVDNVEENASSSQIFPNPVSSVVSVTTEKVAQNVSVYDVYGRLVLKQPVSDTQFELDMNELSPGAYLMRINYGDSHSVHRIMKVQ